MHGNYHGPAEGIASSASEKPVWATKRPTPPWLIIIFTLRTYPQGGRSPSFIGAACDPFQRSCPPSWPVYPSSRDQRLGRRPGPTVGSSSSPTRRTAMASTSAWPGARNAAPMPPSPIAGRGILPRLPPTAVSTRMKSRARFPRPARAAAIPVAVNTSPLPAGARLAIPANPPHRRPRNDVTLPREAGMKPSNAPFFEVRDWSRRRETNFGDDQGFG